MKGLIVILLLFIFLEFDLFAQLTVTETKTLNPTSINYVAQVKNGSTTTYNSTIYGIGRQKITDTNSEIYRTYFNFDLSTISTTATIQEVKISYSTQYKSYSFKLTNISSLTSDLGAQWNAIGNGSAIQTGIAYGSNDFISSSAKIAVQNALSSRKIYIGSLGENETSDDSHSEVYITLIIKYNRPAEQLEFTAKNDMEGATWGQIGVGVNTTAGSQTSPYLFNAYETNTINLQAYDNQLLNNYTWIYNDSEAPLNKSKWDIWILGNRTKFADNAITSRIALKTENTATFLAVLIKKCNITFRNKHSGGEIGGQIKVNGANYTSPSPNFVVIDKNEIIGNALNHSINGIDFSFSSWSDGGGSSYSHTFTPSTHKDYEAIFIGRPNNTYRNQSFNPKVVGQPIKVYWNQHPNTNVTQYKVYRKPKFGSESCVGTFSRTGDLNYVYCFTDPTYSHTNDNSTTNLLMYDVRAYYAPDGNYADYDFRTTYGEIEAIAANGASEERKEVISYEYSVSNYPNPYNPSTTINYSIKDAGNVQIVVYDALGRRVTELVNEVKEPGSYNIHFDGSKLSNGVYYYMMKSGDFVQTKKMILMK